MDTIAQGNNRCTCVEQKAAGRLVLHSDVRFQLRMLHLAVDTCTDAGESLSRVLRQLLRFAFGLAFERGPGRRDGSAARRPLVRQAHVVGDRARDGRLVRRR